MKELVNENIEIENMIYEIRGKQVMLDSDLAKLYNYAQGTKALNQAVKRNIDRFPSRFYFKLTKEETIYVNQSQSVTGLNTRKYSSVEPYVFTEQGVAMLATILKTKVATEVSIRIMDAFVMMRKLLSNNNYINRLSNIETKLVDYDNKFDIVFDKLSSHIDNYNLFYEGQIYDAYSLMRDIFNTSKESIVIIDNYIDKVLLDIISKTNKKITIITNKYNDIDLYKYKSQYSNLNIIISNAFHDRFIIIDSKYLYHSGASFKDLGKKCFAITKINDNEILHKLNQKLK